jgi:hypothetical protein
MFRFGAWDAFGIGLAAGLSGYSLLLLTTLPRLIPTKPLLSLLGFVVPVLVVVPMAAGAAAIGTWRAAFLALMRGRRRAPILRTAGACAIGGVVGGVLPATMPLLIIAAGGESDMGFEQTAAVSPTFLALAGAMFCLLLALALTFVLAAFLAWVEATARCWLAVSLPGASPGPAFVLGLTLCLLVATLWVTLVPPAAGLLASMTYDHGRAGPLAIFWWALILTQVDPIGPIAWFGIVALWAFPLSAALWPRRRTAASWAFLPPAPPSTSRLPDVPIFLRRALLLGLVGGVAAVLAAIWFPLPLATTSLRGIRGLPETEAVARLMARLLTGVAAQGLVAVLAALTISRLAILHAMCAAFATGGLFALSEMFRVYVSGHGWLGLGAAQGSGGAAEWGRAHRAPWPAPPRPGARRSCARRRTALARAAPHRA